MLQSIYLIRHAKATGQEPNAELTDDGLRQAERLAEKLAVHSIAYIVSSPWKRALQTAAPLARAASQHIHTDERLQERVLSTRHLENWMEVLERTYTDENFAEEGGESSRIATARGMEVLEECWSRPEQSVAVITHGNILSLLLRHYQRSFGYEEWRLLTNPDVYVLERQRGEQGPPSIRRIWTD
ncbi:histidine phosphatase family protein [Paenibacillus illinoisensis]|uniref:histidine phosphatase family protein n=1 Tax=Paenibacillus illinoisensis TaxID=59845 RepID=UPI002816306E|nr:histidine phosphatase family protein [Paenibacillus illinoisensis]